MKWLCSAGVHLKNSILLNLFRASSRRELLSKLINDQVVPELSPELAALNLNMEELTQSAFDLRCSWITITLNLLLLRYTCRLNKNDNLRDVGSTTDFLTFWWFCWFFPIPPLSGDQAACPRCNLPNVLSAAPHHHHPPPHSSHFSVPNLSTGGFNHRSDTTLFFKNH